MVPVCLHVFKSCVHLWLTRWDVQMGLANDTDTSSMLSKGFGSWIMKDIITIGKIGAQLLYSQLIQLILWGRPCHVVSLSNDLLKYIYLLVQIMIKHSTYTWSVHGEDFSCVSSIMLQVSQLGPHHLRRGPYIWPISEDEPLRTCLATGFCANELRGR